MSSGCPVFHGIFREAFAMTWLRSFGALVLFGVGALGWAAEQDGRPTGASVSPPDNVVESAVPTVGVRVDDARIVSQALYSENACVPASVLNALRFGPPSFRKAFDTIPGEGEKDKLTHLVKTYGVKPSVVEPGPAYDESSGIKAEDIPPFFNAILKDHGGETVEGTYFDRQPKESTGDHLRRVHGCLARSLAAGIPVVVSFRSFAAHRMKDKDDFLWEGVGAHVVLVTRVPRELDPRQKGFAFEFVEPHQVVRTEGYVGIEEVRGFKAVKGSGQKDFTWLADSPFLLVTAPVLNIGTRREAWYARSFITLNYGAGRFREAAAGDALRRAFLEKARPAVAELLADAERRSGVTATFLPLPDNAPVGASFVYDTARHEAQVCLRKGWEDVDAAHEIVHFRLDLVEGESKLAWRRDVPRTEAAGAAFGRVQTYVEDEIVHARLAAMGLSVDGEIYRPPLFDSLYADAARRLEAGRERPDDGMAHLDKKGYGALARTCFLVQAELLLKNYRAKLPPKRVEQTERFIKAFRAHRAEEAARADSVLALFAKHDVMTPGGHREILKAWAAMEGLDTFVGVTAYRKESEGRYVLPYPE
jgi:hypothetical protein